jgi:hypothetical protein
MLFERAASIVWRQGQIKHELFEMTRPFFWRRAANPAGRPAGAAQNWRARSVGVRKSLKQLSKCAIVGLIR